MKIGKETMTKEIKYLPIKEKDVKRYIRYCDEWGYGNKDTCKYVADMLIEDLIIDNNFKSKTAQKYWSDFISLAHNMKGGGKFNNIIERANND
jgi:hypothetical protein